MSKDPKTVNRPQMSCSTSHQVEIDLKCAVRPGREFQPLFDLVPGRIRPQMCCSTWKGIPAPVRPRSRSNSTSNVLFDLEGNSSPCSTSFHVEFDLKCAVRPGREFQPLFDLVPSRNRPQKSCSTWKGIPAPVRPRSRSKSTSNVLFDLERNSSPCSTSFQGGNFRL